MATKVKAKVRVAPTGNMVVARLKDGQTQRETLEKRVRMYENDWDDILTAVAIASWTTGVKNVLPAPTSGALTASTAVRTTAARNISIVIATANLTAGKFDVVLFVIPPLA